MVLLRDERESSWNMHKTIAFNIFGLKCNDIEKLYDPKVSITI